jgi:iron complex outermembrane receptor protein
LYNTIKNMRSIGRFEMERATCRPGAILLIALCCLAVPASAQEDDDDESVIQEIVVTGSRIVRDEFTSPSPIQILDVDAGRQIGVTSIAELLFRSPVTNGAQIDSTLNTNALTSNQTEASPPGGVGSSNISLRGLEPERTLILMDGRRLGSTGVRGAPSQPDISMIPFALVEQVQVLTEGASAIYGADAVAGVVNVILRKDFEGVEVMASTQFPGETGGEVGQLSFLAGLKNERGSLQFAAEYFERSRVVTGDREWAHCLRDIQQIDDGRIESVCQSGLFDTMAVTSAFDFLFFTDGQSDTGIPNWSTYNAVPPPSHPLVQDPMSFGRYTYTDLYTDQDERRNADLVGEIERFSAVVTGNLSVDWWSNEEIYFESMFLNSRVFSKATTEQLFPAVLGQIPQEDANGNIIVDATGSPILVDNPMNPFPFDILPLLTLDSVPQNRNVEREQSRFLLGIRGDIGNTTWTWDAFLSYDRGIGFQAQPILFEPHLQQSLYNLRLDANGDVTCDFGGGSPIFGFGFVTPEPCVPLDFNNRDLYIGGPTGEGIFTQAEAAYLVGNRTNRTVVEQTIFSTYATGEWFAIGDRNVAMAIGAEYRQDEIDSQNGIVGVQSLNAAESPLQEGTTIGDREIFEAFVEINLPLLESLDFDAAARFTDEENFGSETTWRARLAWRPLDYLSLSGSVGTSFRAPNLREQFLGGQAGGVSGSIDPCRTSNVQQAVAGSGDMDPHVVNLTTNCQLAGVEMIDSDGNGFLDEAVFFSPAATIPTSASGSEELLPETSESYTVTLQFEQPWTDKFGFEFAVSYWDITIENTVAEQEPNQVLGDCYSDIDFPNLSSPLCGQHTRSMRANGFAGLIDLIDISFINIGEQTARGFDYNTRFAYSFDGPGIELGWRIEATQQLERTKQIFSVEDRDDNLGEIGTPEWRLSSTLSLLFRDWEFLMQNRYIGSGEQDNLQDFGPRRFRPLLSREVAWVDSVWYTDLSVTYAQDSYSVTAGVSNLFDEPPPLISRRTGPNRNNAVTSSGYDLMGRAIFLTGKIGF